MIGAALERGIEFESIGVTVIPCGGKSYLDRPCCVFQQFNIPVYLMWDSDRDANGANPRENHILLRLMNHPISDWPSGVYSNFTCFENQLEDTVRNEAGQAEFDATLLDVQTEFGYHIKGDAVKNPYVFKELLARLRAKGCTCNTLDSTIYAIEKLKSPG